jgi:hypothetical protein
MKKLIVLAVLVVLGMATAISGYSQENVTFRVDGNNATPISTSRSGGFHKADTLVTSYTWKNHQVIVNKNSGRCWYINSSNRRSYIQDQEYCKWICSKVGVTYVPPKPRTNTATK